MPKEKEAVPDAKQAKQDAELESKLEKQSKSLWEIKDKLREHVSTAELREILTVNNQDATGSEYDLRERWLVHFMPITSIAIFLSRWCLFWNGRSELEMARFVQRYH